MRREPVMCSPRHICHSWWLAVCSSAHRSGRQPGSFRWSYLPYRVNIHVHARTGGETHFIDTRDSAASRHLANINKEELYFSSRVLFTLCIYTLYDIRYSSMESMDESVATLLCCKQCVFLFEISPVHWEFQRRYFWFFSSVPWRLINVTSGKQLPGSYSRNWQF